MPVRLVSNEELPGPLKGYRLIERLGRGGFGEVWKAEAPGGLLKAVKFVFGDTDSIDEDESRPAQQEEKALHRVKTIRHPYILSLERFDKIDGQLIIVMELADKNLWDRFRECRARQLVGVPREELLGYLDEAAEALDLMNDHYNIQHLDVKPQNLFLVYNHVKVADFGLAKMFEGARGTITGGVTPVYAGPETFEGYVSRFTDQYSLAICYQELLTGRRPFEGANTKQLLMQHLNAVPDVSSLPPGERAVIARALSKKPDDRWPSNAEMVRALRAVRPGATGSTGSGAYGMPQRVKSDTPMPSLPASPATALVTAVAPATGVATARGAVTEPAAAARSLLVNQLTTTGPRLVTQQGSISGLAPALTQLRTQAAAPPRPAASSAAADEQVGGGVLFPALVIGVGATGLGVLLALRRSIREQFGRPDAIPSLRFLYLDTDPDAPAVATSGPDALSPREVLLTRLNRPTHYLQHPTMPPPEPWMPPGMLYQLPKNAGPAGGVRGFGRLAFCDHYRAVSQRVRQEVEGFRDGDALARVGEATGLGVRSSRGRVYVVAGTAGGTGSGMFLDLAYLAKSQLRGLGYPSPEAVGVLLVPPADAKSAKNQGLVNSYAALAELYHFSAGARYEARLDGNEPAADDAEGPFARVAVLPLPRLPKPSLQAAAYGLAARGLFTELLTTAGRVADYVRSVTPARAGAGPVVQSFGLYRLTWPRAELLTAATRSFNRQLLARWAAKDSAHLREPLAAWLDELWARQKLDVASVVARFHAAATEALRESPEAVFAAAVDTLRTRTPGVARLDTSAACVVLDQLIRLVGRPDGEQSAPGTLEATVNDVARAIVAESDADLSTLAVSFIEQPQYRLAGAEEALAQHTRRLRETIEVLEARLAEAAKDLAATYSRLFQVIGTLSTSTGLTSLPGRKATLTYEMYDLLQAYPARRLQYLECNAAALTYRGLLANIPDYVRDVNFCRTRLAEMGQAFADPPGGANAFPCGTLILPAGCGTVASTVTQIVDALPSEDILAYDQALQKDLAKTFRGLANLCLKADRTPDFLTLLTARTRAFLDARLETTDPATILLRYQGEGAGLTALLLKAYDGAAPGVGPDPEAAGPGPVEATLLALPSGRAADQVRRALQGVTAGVEFIPAPLANDIAVYREYPRLELAALPQLGPHARDAYRQRLSGDLSPHSRADVRWTAPQSG